MTVLNNLVEQYGNHKVEFDKLKSICDAENAQIKQLMVANGYETYPSDTYIAKYYEQERTSFNADKALAILKRAGINQCVKMVEVLDEDALETMLYNGEIPSEILPELHDCTTIKKVPALKISIQKGKKNGLDNK